MIDNRPMDRIAIRADLLDFTGDPGWSAADDAGGVRRWRRDLP